MKRLFTKRYMKNTLAVLLIAAMCGCAFFTMKYAQSHVSSRADTMMSQPAGDGSQTADQHEDSSGDSQSAQSAQSGEEQGAVPDSQSSGSSDRSSGSSDQQPPAKPDGDSGGAPTQQSSDTQTADNSGQSDASAQSQDQQNGQASGDQQSSDSQSGQQPGGGSQNDQNADGQNGQGGTPPDMNASGSSSTLPIGYYFVFGAEGIILAAGVMYLIMTRAGKKSVKELTMNRDKITIFILSAVLLASAFTFSCSSITGSVFISSAAETGQMGGPGGQSSGNASYSAVKEITSDETIKDETYSSENSDENAVLATGSITVQFSDTTITKTGDSDGGDTSNFYGNNSGITAKDGAALTLKNMKITTDASGANGVFSYGGSATTSNSSGDGTSVTISDSEITTTGDNAGGIMTTGGGTMTASDLTINTSGRSSAAIRTDRGGGSVDVTGGTYTTTGIGSPSVYSTADIIVNNARLVSKASEGIVIEGKNSVTLNDCTLTDNNTELNGQSTTYKNIFLYQSMSGDAADGNAEFTAADSKITTKKGDTLYVTNTTATINLENNTIKNTDSEGNFLRAQADSWGNSGSNGGDVTLVMTKQKATGNIVIDSISTLDITMKSGSYYEGTINGDNSARSIKLTLDKKSKIKLTGDSYVTSLDDADTDYSNIDFNGYTLYVNGEAIN